MKSLVLTIALLASPALAQSGQPPFRVDPIGKVFWRLDDAVRAVGDADAVINIAPGTYHDCASVHAGHITFRAIQPGTVTFDGTTCDGKAALVLHGRGARVEGIIFENMRVPDANGAGIRLEAGNLDVVQSVFLNSEEGILTADDPTSAITVDHSSFSGLGRCDKGLSCAHAIYVGNYGSLTVTHSRFERGNGGQYFKSRAGHNVALGNSFDDSHGHATNYIIDLCAGSTGRISGNTIVMGRDKENHSAIIAVAAESRDHPSQGLVITGNTATLAPGADYPTTFVADWSHEPLAIGQNRLGGGIKQFETR